MFYEIIVRRSPSAQWQSTGLRWPSKTYMVKTAGWFTIGTHEVETYTFHAEITDKAVTDEYRSSTEYHIFWCNGEEAGSERVGSNVYARYSIGDLIEIEAVIEQDWFGNEYTSYNVTGN